jgi:hypothetical protein
MIASRLLPIGALLLLASVSARAEYRRVELKIFGMD